MSGLRDSTSNDSFFHPSSPEPLPMDGYEEDKPQTVSRMGGMPPLSSDSFDEKNSHGTREQPTATYQTTQQGQLSSSEELSSRKRSMTLDLHSPGASQSSSKQARCSSLLTSPDLQMLALSTPELERLIITLNGRDPTVSRLFVLTVTEKEEQYPCEFPESLNQLQLQPRQPALRQHATSDPKMSDLHDSTSNDSFFHPSSSKHLPMGGYEEDKPQTVSRLGGMPPLFSASFDEKIGDGTSEQPTATYQTMQQEQLSSGEELSSRKRSMTMNLHSPGASQRSSKQARCSSLLTSPDLQMLALSTPELERFIITLNGRDPTVSRLFVLTVTEKGEQYPSDFPESLDQLQLQPRQPTLQQQATSGPDTSDSTSDESFSCPLSSEPETVPRLSSTPPQLPIDMCDRYRLMLEQKRESNRIAARKSLQRKFDRISELEEKVYALKMEKTVLEYNASILRYEVYQLSQAVMTHMKEGCKM